MNLTLLSGFAIFACTQSSGASFQAVIVGLSTGVAFLQFCGIVLHAIVAPRCPKSCCRRRPSQRDGFDTNIVEPVADDNDSTGYRDSILDDDDEGNDDNDETQPLITNDSDAKYKQLE